MKKFGYLFCACLLVLGLLPTGRIPVGAETVADGTCGESRRSPAAARSAAARSFATLVSRRIFMVTAIGSSLESTILVLSGRS